MQIHEITKRSLREGILSNIGRGLASGVTGVDLPRGQSSIDRNAAQAAKELQAQGYGKAQTLPTVQQAISAVKKNPAQQQYIKGLVAQWQQSAPKTAPAIKTSNKPVMPSTRTSTPRSSLPSITIGGKLLTKGSDGLWHGETGAAVTDTAQAAKIDKAYQAQQFQKKQFQQTAMVREDSEEYTTPSGIVIPSGTRTDKVFSPSNTSYQDAFEKWAAEKLQTVDPHSRKTITLDQIKKTDIGDELDRALAQVAATAGDAQKNATAVDNYLSIAVAGVARRSQELRQNTKRTDTDNLEPADQTTAQAVVTQQDIQNKLTQEVGLSTNQIAALKQVAQDPANRNALLKSFGVTA